MIRNEKGFTLIEIIAVLVILGILAAIAIPKFIDLQNEARIKSIDSALATGGSNAFMLYSKSLLGNGGTSPTMASLTAALSVTMYQNVGDFSVTYDVVAAIAPCTKAIAVTFYGGPPNGETRDYITGSAPTKTFCIE